VRSTCSFLLLHLKVGVADTWRTVMSPRPHSLRHLVILQLAVYAIYVVSNSQLWITYLYMIK
jgi:hypothetical protein